MADTFELTEEYVYRVAPDGKSCKSASDLVKAKAFRGARLSDHGRRLEAQCKSSGRDYYSVRVDLHRPGEPATSCNCMSFKRPCKHAIGLMFLAVRSPGEFEQDQSSRQRQRRESPLIAGGLRDAAVELKPPPPKDTGEAIFQAVLAEPEDDTPRLVYADWLEETGGPEEQARAEFIRVQIELAHLPESDSRVKDLRSREKQLWSTNKVKWLATLPEGLRRRKQIAFHRGFFEEVYQPTTVWVQCSDELFRNHPVYRLRMPHQIDRNKAGALVVQPELKQFRALSLLGCRFIEPTKTLDILFGTPFFTNVTTLNVRDAHFGSRELALLAASPMAPRLRVLELSDNNLGPKGVEVLTTSPQFDGLCRLILHGSSLLPGLYRELEERFGDRLVRAE